jgi:uncharacterized cupin superfamily protein
MSSLIIDREGFLANAFQSVKGPCRVATTANITLSAVQIIDGVQLEADDRVLVKDQANTSENAIYVCKTAEWELSLDFDQRGHVVKGTRVFVTDGTANGQTEWYVTTTGRPIPGREAISFSQFTDGNALAEHIADTAGAHAASAISVTPTGALAATDAQAAFAELDGDITTVAAAISAHIADTSEAHAASAISFSATGNISSTSVQAALSELDTDKEPVDAAILRSDTPATLTVGFNSTSYNIGTVSTGTLTPVSSNGNFQHVINSGGHALAPPVNPCSIVLEYQNSTSPGAITTTGFGNLVSGSPSTVASISYQAAILKTSTIASLTWVSS